MADASQNLSDKLALLRAKYIAQFTDRFVKIEDALALLELKNSAEQKIEGLKKLEFLTHKLAGSGGTYGFPELSEAARKVEHACIEIHNLDQDISAQDFDRLSKLVQELAQAKPVN